MDESLDILSENGAKLLHKFTNSQTPCMFAMFMITFSLIAQLFTDSFIADYLFVTGLLIFSLKSILTRFMYLWYSVKEYDYGTMSGAFVLLYIVVHLRTNYISRFYIFISILYFYAWIDAWTYDIRCYYKPCLRTQTNDEYYKNINRYAKNIYLTNKYVALSFIVIVANISATMQ